VATAEEPTRAKRPARKRRSPAASSTPDKSDRTVKQKPDATPERTTERRQKSEVIPERAIKRTSERKTGRNSEPQSERKAGRKTEPQADVKADPRPEPVPQPAPRPKPERNADAKADSKPGRKSERTAGRTADRKLDRKSSRKSSRKTAKSEPLVPPGPLHVIVSIDKQRVTLFAGGKPVTSSTISSGTPGHPTPMGVFSVIQKRRHHISNLYDAPMPFMQRLTWSGTAMHQGPLPGRPASHGCIRLTDDFAQLLWKTTKIGARVIVTRDEVAPVEIDLPKLFAPRPTMARAFDTTAAAPRALVRTADATDVLPATVAPGANRPIVSEIAANASAPAQATKIAGGGEAVTLSRPAPAPAPAATELSAAATAAEKPLPVADERPAAPALAVGEARKSTDPVSVFVSRKEAKLYVRQKWQPLFQAPVSIASPARPIGTHVFTAMAKTDDDNGVRWSVVSIPSSFKPAVEPKKSEQAKKSRHKKPARLVEAPAEPLPDAREALDRIDIPADAVERIAPLLVPGSSFIVSDNRLSDETGEYTDFIVLTP
jgi:lipoprotein-anchoring transpeptidase ErfK/SrfK